MELRLSERGDFNDALILSADYMSNPAMNGECELGIRWLDSGIEIWEWVDELGAEEITRYPRDTTLRKIMGPLLADDRYPAAVSLHGIGLIGDRPPLGQLLSLLWADGEFHKKAIGLLLRLCDDDLFALSQSDGDGLLSADLLRALQTISEFLYESDIELDDLPDEIHLAELSPHGLTDAFKQAGVKVQQDADEAIAEKQRALAPFKDEIRSICGAWESMVQIQRQASGQKYPPLTSARLTQYLETAVLTNSEIPRGVHVIPGGRGWMGRTEPPVTVDIDELIKAAASE